MAARGLALAMWALAAWVACGCEGKGPSTQTSPAQMAARPAPDLLRGGRWEYSSDNGLSWSDAIHVTERTIFEVVDVRVSFEVPDPSRYVSLSLGHNLPQADPPPRFAINDVPVAAPLEGMLYRITPGIPAGLLRPGTNVLLGQVLLDARHFGPAVSGQGLHGPLRLAPHEAAELRFQTGPVLGHFGDDFFSLACRTSLPAEVTLSVEPAEPPPAESQASILTPPPQGEGGPKGRPLPKGEELRPASAIASTTSPAAIEQVSPPGMLHRFRAPRPATPHLRYRLTARVPGREVSTPWRTIHLVRPSEINRPLRVVVMGDSRSFPRDWARVAAAALAAKPDLVLFTGDNVSTGRCDWQWDEDFFGQRPELFATIPFYPVIGNHEGDCALYDAIFYGPDRGTFRNYAQQIGPLLVIGIDGRDDWWPDGELAAWLEESLRHSTARFSFLASHYPPYSSGPHGALDYYGRPVEMQARLGRQTILPLLDKYRATAMFCGHDHDYERSELPSGLTIVVAGASGAPIYKKVDDAAIQNPFSAAFASLHHFCLVEIDGDTCQMQALTPRGQTIDSRIWKARN